MRGAALVAPTASAHPSLPIAPSQACSRLGFYFYFSPTHLPLLNKNRQPYFFIFLIRTFNSPTSSPANVASWSCFPVSSVFEKLQATITAHYQRATGASRMFAKNIRARMFGKNIRAQRARNHNGLIAVGVAAKLQPQLRVLQVRSFAPAKSPLLH